MSRRQLVFGIDGGGTKSTGLAGDEFGNLLAKSEAGPTNPNVVGIEKCAKTMVQLISDCSEEIGCDIRDYRAIVIGLSGAGSDANRKKILEAINRHYKTKGASLPITIETDARTALEGSFDGASGVVVIAGTGSVVMGKTLRGDVIRTGGWGRILGDEGSGYYIGRKALAAVAQHLDKRGDAGKLSDAFAKRFQWKTREDIVTAVYQDHFDIASLAPVVFESATTDDIVSQRILQKAASHLAEQIRGVVFQLGILRKVGLVMCGSLIDHETVYANVLHMKIMKSLPQVEVRSPLYSPAHGAVLMARDRLKRI